MKTFVIAINILIIIFAVYLYISKANIDNNNTTQSQKEIESQSTEILFLEPKITGIDSLIWQNDKFVFKNNDGVFRYDIAQRNLDLIPAQLIIDTHILGIKNDEIILCSWKNFERKNPTDIGTSITLYSINGDILKAIDLKETLMIQKCQEDLLTLSNAYSFLQENYYTYSLNSEKLVKIRREEVFPYQLKGTETIEISENSKIIFNIKRRNDVKSFWVSNDRKSLVLLTNTEKVWIYQD